MHSVSVINITIIPLQRELFLQSVIQSSKRQFYIINTCVFLFFIDYNKFESWINCQVKTEKFACFTISCHKFLNLDEFRNLNYTERT